MSGDGAVQGGGAVLYCSGGWCCPVGAVQEVLSRGIAIQWVLFRGWCYSGGGAIQGLVLSITGSDIITSPINRMTDRQT